VRGDDLYRAEGAPWRASRSQGCAQGRLGVGVPTPVGLQPKVGDDGRNPPVSDSRRWGAQLGRQRAGLRSGGCEGEPAAELRGHGPTSAGGLRRKQERKEGRKEGRKEMFSSFLKKNKQKFKHKFEFNNQK
jgi:hypothetical protein